MITLLKWKMLLEEWRSAVEEECQNKKVKCDYEYDRANIGVENDIAFLFRKEKNGFLFVRLENCNEEQFQHFGEKLMNLIQKHEMDVFVKILHGTGGWFENKVYETEGMLEEYIASGNNAKEIVKIMKKVKYRRNEKNEFCVLDYYDSLFDASITLDFHIEGKSMLLMIGKGERECYKECFSAEEVNAFAAMYKKEKKQIEVIEQKANELLEKTYPGENADICFEFSRSLGTNFYDLEFYVDETHKRIYMDEIKEEEILSLIMEAKRVGLGKKDIQKELKQHLYQKDPYAYQFDKDIHLFQVENKVKIYVNFHDDPENYRVHVEYGELVGNMMRYEVKEFVGTKDEVLEKAKKFFDVLYNSKRMANLFSSTNSHIEKMMFQVAGEKKRIVYDENLTKGKDVIEKEIQNFYKDSAERNGIPKINWVRHENDIVLETVRFFETNHGTIHVRNI